MTLQYHLICNKSFPTSADLEIRNRVYSLWKSNWEKIYADQGAHHVPTADDFTRHDLLSVLMTDQDQLVGFSCHTFLDFHELSTYDRDYFSMFGKNYSQALKAMKIDRVMTFESLVVRPEFQRNTWGLPLGRLIMRLNSYMLSETSAEAMMAVARKDNGVSQNLTVLGYQMIESDKICRGFPCDLQTLSRGRHLLEINDKTEPHAGNLWQMRTVHGGKAFYDLPTQQPASTKAA